MPVGTQATVKAVTPDEVRADRRRDPARQHLSPDAAAGRRAHRGARRPAQIHELAGTDPDRFRRLPGHVAVAAAQDRRAGGHLPLAYRRRDVPAFAGARDRNPAAAWRRHRDAARRMPASCRRRATRSSAPCSCRCAGRSAASARSRRRPPAAHCSASCRAATIRRCACNSARALVDMDFHGYAIGGLAVGEPQAVMLSMIETVAPLCRPGARAT